MDPDADKKFRKHLLKCLEGGHAHKTFDDAVADFPVDLINKKCPGAPYTFWQLLEHICITQNDILKFITNPNYAYLNWPKDYWPEPGKQADVKTWKHTITNYKKDLRSLERIVKNRKRDLTASIPHAEEQCVFWETLLVLCHTSYHIGQLILMRRAMDNWNKRPGQDKAVDNFMTAYGYQK